jgi:hypothetical protein
MIAIKECHELGWQAQVRKGGRTPLWVEQAGKGGKRKVGRLAIVTTSAPPLSRQTKILVGASEPRRGRARGL